MFRHGDLCTGTTLSPSGLFPWHRAPMSCDVAALPAPWLGSVYSWLWTWLSSLAAGGGGCDFACPGFEQVLRSMIDQERCLGTYIALVTGKFTSTAAGQNPHYNKNASLLPHISTYFSSPLLIPDSGWDVIGIKWLQSTFMHCLQTLRNLQNKKRNKN